MYLIIFRAGKNEKFTFYRKVNRIPTDKEFYDICLKEFPAYCYEKQNLMEIVDIINLDKTITINI